MKRIACRLLLALALASVSLPVAAERKPGVADELLPVIRASGVEAGIELYERLRETHAKELDFGEPQLNVLGYRLLQEKLYAEAITILELNVRMFPRSANARDSLAEAHLRTGNEPEARKHYMRALSMLKSMRGSATRRQAVYLKRNIRRQLERMELLPVYRRLEGVYRDDRGAIYSISLIDAEPSRSLPGLRLVELHSGLVRNLHRKSDHEYWTGPGIGERSPVESSVRFIGTADDRAAVVEISRESERSRAERVPLDQTELVFHNDDVELEGSLLLPDRPGPYPAIVLVHGSGNVTRYASGLGELSHLLAMHGFAVLRYDKRGAGRSAAGTDVLPSLADLAGDAAAAIDLVAARDDVDGERVGLLGFSEGAWVAGIAAAESRGVDFVVLLAGGGVTPWQQDLYRCAAELTAAGFSDEQIEQARRLARLRVEVARSGDGWEELTTEMVEHFRSPWYRFVPGWPSMAYAHVVWQEVWSHDPQTVLGTLEIPVLAILAEKDVLTPLDATRDALTAAFSGERSTLLTIEQIRGANHVFLECDSCAVRFTRELSELDRYAPSFFDTLTSWLEDQTIVGRDDRTSAKLD